MNIVNRTITKNVIVYVAEDGTEFSSEYECKNYENTLCNKKEDYFRRLLEPKHITSIDNWYPYDEYTNADTHDYYWYRIDNEEDLAYLNKAYRFFSDCKLSTFPEIICVDISIDGECYYYELSSMIKTLNEFFENVGYEIKRANSNTKN